MKSKIHCETNFFCHLKVNCFFAVFGPLLDQKWVNPQFFGAVGLCINVSNDSRRERNFFLQKCSQKQDFSVLGGLTPLQPPQVPLGGQGYFFLIDTSFLLQDKYDSKKKLEGQNYCAIIVCLGQSYPVKTEDFTLQNFCNKVYPPK